MTINDTKKQVTGHISLIVMDEDDNTILTTSYGLNKLVLGEKVLTWTRSGGFEYKQIEHFEKENNYIEFREDY